MRDQQINVVVKKNKGRAGDKQIAHQERDRG